MVYAGLGSGAMSVWICSTTGARSSPGEVQDHITEGQQIHQQPYMESRRLHRMSIHTHTWISIIRIPIWLDIS